MAEAEQMRIMKEEFGADVPRECPDTRMTNTLAETPTKIEMELEEHLQAITGEHLLRG